MMIYYDILLLDGRSFVNVRRSERFMALSNLISCRTGWAELVHYEIIDFGHKMGASNLRKAFAKVILSKKEGLVLKPDDPYFDFADIRRPFSSSCIKLKKEYIGNFGDVGDFAVVGARYEAAKARTYHIAGLKWTHFYLGCLDNREQVKRWGAKPEFTVVNVVELNETMLRDVVSHGDHESIAFSENDRLVLKLTVGVQQGKPMDVVFARPMVFDLRCFSFDKVGNTGFWSPRFPNVTKVHFDRDFTDTVSFEELQTMAEDSTTVKELEDSQENLGWIAKLEGADPRGAGIDALSQLTATTMPTPSPRRSSQNSTASWSPTSPAAKRLLSALGPPRQALLENRPLGTNPANTPLTSSTPQCAPPSSEKESLKRPVCPFMEDTSPCKRPKFGQMGELQDPGPLSQQTPQASQTRKPLADINGNSQHSQSLPSFSCHTPSDEELEPEIIDLTSSPGASFTTAVTTRLHSSQTHPSSPVVDATILIVPDEEQQEDCDQPLRTPKDKMPSPPMKPDEAHQDSPLDMPPQAIEFGEIQTGSLGEPEPVASSQDTAPNETHQNSSSPRTDCQYAHDKCWLAKVIVLVEPSVTDRESFVLRQLSKHGVPCPVQNIDLFLAREEAEVRLGENWEPGPSTILFIDSQDKSGNTHDWIKKVNSTRDRYPPERRGWIQVYDWRVLKYLTIKEDDKIEEKYYDGFNDPWKRWYCGIV